MAKIHYIPRFILKEFRHHGRLLELSLQNCGPAYPRDYKQAAQREDFWPDFIEQNVMCRLDDAASKVLQGKVYGKTRYVTLTPQDRQRLASWLGVLIIRTPRNYADIVALRQKLIDDPKFLMGFVHKHGAMSIYRIIQLRRNGAVLRSAFQYCGNWGEAWVWFLSFYEVLARKRGPEVFPLVDQFFTNHLRDSETAESLSKWIMRMKWNWLYDPQGQFVIGDDPVFRYSPRFGKKAGLRLRDVEVTVPLSRQICLQLTNRGKANQNLIRLDRKKVVYLNRRQIGAAFEFVYGPTQVALRPDDPNAEIGF